VILRELRSLGLEDDTIVVFTSDNGSLGDRPAPVGGDGTPLGGSNGPLRGSKGGTWEGGLRVPGIVRWPGRIRAGRVSSELATAMDLHPTLAGLCGATVPDDRVIDGRDLSAVWFDETAASPREVFLYYWMNDLEAVRDRRFKLHFAKRGRELSALYDLVSDIGETTDVAADHPDVVSRLEAAAEAARHTLGDARSGRSGSQVRPIGRVAEARPLTTFDPEHPYYLAEYDLSERG
jgi:arylsulfatase A-like enzyme